MTSTRNEILSAIENGDDIIFITYSSLMSTEEDLKFALIKILEKYQREDIFTPVFSCTKELISNAIKANAKSILIKDKIISDPEDKEDVVKKIRAILNKKSLLAYGIRSKSNHLSTRIYLKVYRKHLFIEVINNIPLCQRDIEKINLKIKKSSKYDSIAEFYMENQDPEAEGMGLGISMIVVLLKNMNITYRNFRITTDGKEKTYAKILIPLAV